MSSRFENAKQILQPTPDSMPDETAIDAFFVGLRVANGTCKMTSSRRLVDVDERVVRCLDDRGVQSAVRLLDAGASTGTTTDDLLQQLERHGYTTEATLLDVAVTAYLCQRAGLELLFDSKSRLLFVCGWGWMSFRPDPESLRLRSRAGRMMFAILERMLVPRQPLTNDHATQVKLVVPAIAANPAVTILEHDLELPLPVSSGSFDLIRAANVLNLAYFSAERISFFLGHLLAVLRAGGLLVIGRTDDDGVNHFSLLRKDESGQLELLERIGLGSEVERIALSVATGGHGRFDSVVA